VIAFLILCYCGILWLVFFKLKLLPWNTVSQAVSAVIGIVAIMELLILINIYQPYSTNATLVKKAIPIVARVPGRVLDVPVKPNTPLKKGDVLFKIDPRPYQYQVDQLKARLSLAQTRLGQSKDLLKDQAGSLYDVEQFKTEVDQLKAQLAKAELDLAETTLYAPADGYVTQLFLKPGAVTLANALSSVMNFVYGEEDIVTVPFRQNSLRHARQGDTVEIAFDTYPGRIFTGSLVDIAAATGEAVLTPSGNLKGATQVPPNGPLWARVHVEDDVAGYLLPAGTNGAVAIYTDKGKALSIIRKVIIRFYTWLNFF
jgi:multidrug resistance efflux pump